MSRQLNFFILEFASGFLYNSVYSKLEAVSYSPCTGRGDHALPDLQVPLAQLVAPDKKTSGLRGGWTGLVSHGRQPI